MNSFETLLSDVFKTLRNFFVTIWSLLFSRQPVLKLAYSQEQNVLMKPLLFLLFCEFLFFAFLNWYSFQSSTQFDAAFQNTSELGLIKLLIPSTAAILLTIYLFSLLIRSESDRRIIRGFCIYYTGIGLLISSTLLVCKVFLYAVSFEYLPVAKQVESHIDSHVLPDYETLFTVLDNGITILIPSYFVYKYSKFTSRFKIYFLAVIAFCFTAFYLCTYPGNLLTDKLKINAASNRLEIIPCDQTDVYYSIVHFMLSGKDSARSLRSNIRFCLLNQTSSTIYLQKRITVELYYFKKTPFQSKEDIESEELIFEIDSPSDRDYIPLSSEAPYTVIAKSNHESWLLKKYYEQEIPNDWNAPFSARIKFFHIGPGINLDQTIAIPMTTKIFIDN